MFPDIHRPAPDGSDPAKPRTIQANSRRGAMMMAIAAPLSMSAAHGATHGATHGAASGGVSRAASAASPLGGLIDRAAQAAAAFMSGDMARWFDLCRPTDDFTLMAPFGGPPGHGFDASPEYRARLARAFRNGSARLEMVESYVAEDLVVLVMIERQHGEVHGLPDQDWSLRVTQVYRRDGSEWRLAHRHADPLVHPVGLERTASLARGDSIER